MKVVSKNEELINKQETQPNLPPKVLIEFLTFGKDADKELLENNFIKPMSERLNNHPFKEYFRGLFFLYSEQQTEQDAIGWLNLNSHAYFTFMADINTEFTDEIFEGILKPVLGWMDTQKLLKQGVIKLHK
jgi:hypothetical protein